MPGRTVYLVVERYWNYDDEFWTGDDSPVRAFASRQAAEEFCARHEMAGVEPEEQDQYRRWLDSVQGQAHRQYIVVEAEVEA
jgi:hypothetical protein